MTDFASFVLLQTSDLLGKGGAGGRTMFEWLCEGNYYPSRVGAFFDLTTYDLEVLAGVADREYGRFLFAGLETAFAAREAEVGSRVGSWSLVKRYYAAYYSAQCLLRALGRYLVYVDGSRASQLKQAFDDRGLATSVDRGYYEIVATLPQHQQATLRMSRVNAGARGNHELFWHVFRKRLKEFVAASVAAGEVGADKLVLRWGELDDVLSNLQSSDGNWLSHIRNEVSYQLAFNAWLPGGIQSTHAVPINVRLMANQAVRLDVDVSAEPIQAFTAACTFLIALANDHAAALASRAAPSTPLVAQMLQVRASL